MKEFILIFRLKNNGSAKPSPEQIEERTNWFKGIVAGDKLADKGNTLSFENGKRIKPDNAVEDGPYIANNELVTGYVVLKTDSIDEAIELAKTNPIFKIGGNVEVREVVKLISGS